MEKETNKNLIANSGAHLSDEQIIAYQYGTLPSPEAERQAQNHLTECRRCANLLIELSEFAEMTNISASNAENTDVQWAQFEQKRLAESEPANQTTAAQLKIDTEPRRNFFRFPSFNFAAAAAFGVLTIIAVTAIFMTLRNREPNESTIARQTQPIVRVEPAAPEKTPASDGAKEIAQANTTSVENSDVRVFNRGNRNSSLSLQSKTKNKPENEIISRPPRPPKTNKTPALSDEVALNTADFSLYPTEVLRGAADDLREIRVKKTSAGQIRLKLNAQKSKSNSGFSVVIADSQNKILLTLPILPDKRGDFYLTIPADKFPADIYSLKIYAEEKSGAKLFTKYNFRLEYE